MAGQVISGYLIGDGVLTVYDTQGGLRVAQRVTETAPVTRILEHIGKLTTAPVLSPARVPPTWEETFDKTPVFGQLAAALAPAFQFDQTVSWQRHDFLPTSANRHGCPPIAPARGPPDWDDAPEPMSDWDLLGPPEPDFELNQRIAW